MIGERECESLMREREREVQLIKFLLGLNRTTPSSTGFSERKREREKTTEREREEKRERKLDESVCRDWIEEC